MSLKPYLSFAGGELDPIMFDRVTLEKFKRALETARNVTVSKSGSFRSRFATAHFIKAKNDNEAIKLFIPPGSEILTEWGSNYVRLYEFDGTLIDELSISINVSTAQFVADNKFIYVLNSGAMKQILYNDPSPEVITEPFGTPIRPASPTLTATGTPAGYEVDYAVTKVLNGQESPANFALISSTYKIPVAASQYNTIEVTVNQEVTSASLNYPDAVSNSDYDEIRVYRRPHEGGAYGFIGSSDINFTSGSDLKFRFVDWGQAADFTNQPPEYAYPLEISGTYPVNSAKTGAIYQGRFLTDAQDESDVLLASRPGFKRDFFRDFPYDGDSALALRLSSSGDLRILRIVENDGLIVFTSNGVYISVGTLGPTNLSFERKGSWVIDENVPPLSVPGGVFFVDSKTNSVRQLIFSENIATYEAIDQSIFSEHLFRKKTISSWCFQGGVAPMILVTFSDGTFASFTYNYEHQMKAWTRHDSRYSIEQVEGTNTADTSFMVVNKDGDRYIAVTLPRFVPAATFEANTESDKLNLNWFMDAIITKSNLLNDSLSGSDEFELALDAGGWDDELTLTCGTSGIFTTGTFGAVGTIMRFFHPVDGSEVDLEVTARTSNNEVTVQPSAEFPSEYKDGFRLYETFNVIDGLDHLDGEIVSVVSDGYVVASPNNDQENYDTLTVSSNQITLPDDQRGAIVCVGRPITADVKTLNVSTVEQKPTLIESINCNKMYMRVYETRGLYIGNEFPETASGGVDGSSVLGMQDLDEFYVPSEQTVIGNRYKAPQSRRLEITIPGAWESQGKISLRQVDPLHFEILSMILDLDVLFRRGD